MLLQDKINESNFQNTAAALLSLGWTILKPNLWQVIENIWEVSVLESLEIPNKKQKRQRWQTHFATSASISHWRELSL